MRNFKSYIFCFVFFIVVSKLSIGQSNIRHFTEMAKLDSILFLNDLGSDARSSKIKTRLENDTFYINYYDRNLHLDTFYLTKINVNTKSITKQYIIIPNLNDIMLDDRLIINDYDVNQDNLVVLIEDNLFHYNYTNNKLTKHDLDINIKYENLKLYGERLILTKAYNSTNPFHEVVKTEIALMDLQTHKIIKAIHPHITNIELTHISIEPITLLEKNIIVAQNYNYSFDIYDTGLNLLQTVKDFKPFKNKFDSTLVRKEYKKGMSSFMRYGSEYFFNSGLLEKAIAVDENTFIISYNDGKSEHVECRLLDLWKRDSVTGQFIFTDRTYLSNFIEYYNTKLGDNTFIFNKENYCEYLIEGTYAWSEKKYVKMSSNAEVYPLGYSLKQLHHKRKDLLEQAPQKICISIFDR